MSYKLLPYEEGATVVKELVLLNEADLRFRISQQYAQVYFAADPKTVLGSQYIGRTEDTFDHYRAWELIDRSLGHIMPADLVDEEYLELFDGVAYIGGGYAFVTCPNCGGGIKGDDLQAQVIHDRCEVTCSNCGTRLFVACADRLTRC